MKPFVEAWEWWGGGGGITCKGPGETAYVFSAFSHVNL